MNQFRTALFAAALVGFLHPQPVYAQSDDINLWATLALVGLGPHTGKEDGKALLSIGDSIRNGDFVQRMHGIPQIITMTGMKRQLTLNDMKTMQEFTTRQLDLYKTQASVKSTVEGAKAEADIAAWKARVLRGSR